MTGHGFIRLINAQGIMIQDILVRIQEGENRFQLSLDGLPSGIYQVQLSCPDGIFSSTLIVQAG